MEEPIQEEQPQEPTTEEITQEILRSWASQDGDVHLTEDADGSVRLCLGDRCYESVREAVDIDELARSLTTLGLLDSI